MNLLTDFILRERERFENEDNNKFAMSFAQISRYRSFLDIILARYEDAAKRFMANTNALRASFLPGTNPVTPAQQTLHEEGAQISSELHLEIESFYLFGKILLDKIAHSLEFYFGPVRKRPLDSNDDLVKNVAAFAAEKSLTIPAGFLERAGQLKTDVSDYRDYEIAHEKSPRRMSGTVFDDSGARIAAVSLYPTEKDQQVESKAVHNVIKIIDGHIEAAISLIEQNRDKSRLKLLPANS
jgi:hypothetical protein